ncbi:MULTISPECIES: transposase [Synechococcales]|uniref:transposase n=1 Tax=Synechococcales TaxID=1890424 RepID=UPI0036F19F80
MTWTPETEPALIRASLPARNCQEKRHESQTPKPRADHPQVRTAEQLLNQCQAVADVCRALEVSLATYHRWQHLYGVMKATVAKRLHP